MFAAGSVEQSCKHLWLKGCLTEQEIKAIVIGGHGAASPKASGAGSRGSHLPFKTLGESGTAACVRNPDVPVKRRKLSRLGLEAKAFAMNNKHVCFNRMRKQKHST